jgi:hypothetical protein
MSDHDKLLRDMELALIAISEPYSFDKPPATSLSARTTPDTEAEMAEMFAALLSRARETRGELQAARADLREAMELLRAHGHPPTWLSLGEAADWNTRYGKLLKKHKETNQ